MTDLFQRTATRAPEELTERQIDLLTRWAEARVPWVTRGALEALTPLDDYTDACLAYFGGTKKVRPDWLGTIKNWIRRDERSRLTSMAKRGNESARLALMHPDKWRDGFDKIERQLATVSPEHTELIIPKDPARAGSSVSLSRRGL